MENGDYINREMAADCIVLECDDVTLEQARQAIKDCPSADVVEVVRCKDCKHHEELLNNNDENVLCWVHDVDIVVAKNGYCSYGERKDDE